MMSAAVLALDLSTPHGVLAVVRGEAVLFEAGFTSERSHNAQVFAPLAQALEVLGRQPARLVVGTGPGSYTGVRIAIAAAQGVALARGWPVIGWPSIASADGPELHVLGDARRGLFYAATVRAGVQDGPVALLDEAAARARVEAGGRWVSFDARPPLGLAAVTLLRPDAVRLARLAAGLSEAQIAEQAARPLEPAYLQEAFITTARKPGKQVAPERA